MRLILSMCLVFAIFKGNATEPAQKTIRISAGADPYIIELINLALSYDEGSYRIQTVGGIPTQDRAIRLLGEQHGIDICWTVTSYEREKLARAIRIPLVKGVLGYRVPLVHENSSDLFKDITYLGDLRKMVFGLRSDWPDHHIFERNDLRVVSFAKEENAFDMLRKQRFDALPIDVLSLSTAITEKQVIVDQHVLFYYPSAVYFFVAKENISLHKKIKLGLEKALLDGKFNALFERYFSERLQQARLKSRQIIKLTNPELPTSAPLEKTALWHVLGNTK